MQLCDYNRDGDSYRSPWTNEYEPPLEDGGFKPSRALRTLEEKANHVFDSYRQLYYDGEFLFSFLSGLPFLLFLTDLFSFFLTCLLTYSSNQGGVSSAYLWDQEDGGFAGCFLLKKEVMEPQRRVSQGCWDSIHVVEALPKASTDTLEKGTFTYRLTTTVILTMITEKGDAGPVNLSGNLTRQAKEKTVVIKDENEHVINIGQMIEEMEFDLRNQLDMLYIQKTRQVVSSIRRPGNHPSQDVMNDLAASLLKTASLNKVE